MNLVVDTNVLVSAFLWQGKPGRLIELAAENEIHLFTSRSGRFSFSSRFVICLTP